MQDNLVIVESPAKAKTIEKFLGKGYVVKSSFGHIRDLAKKGLGIDIANNVRIPLSDAARSLYDKTCYYADILIESATDSMGVILECQGRSAHDSEAASLSDAERATALTSMGYDVIQITYDQIKEKKSFDHIAELIHKKAGLTYVPKTKQERTAEDVLRQELLVDWVELFTAGPAS